MATQANDTLQLNFFAFRENRLPFGVHVIDSNEPIKMKLVVILNPRRDHHGKVHAACALDIDLSSDVSFRKKIEEQESTAFVFLQYQINGSLSIAHSTPVFTQDNFPSDGSGTESFSYKSVTRAKCRDYKENVVISFNP